MTGNKYERIEIPHVPAADTPFLELRALESDGAEVFFDSYFEEKWIRCVLRFEFCLMSLMRPGRVGSGGFSELVSGSWIVDMISESTKGSALVGLRHFIVTGHDVSVEVLARGFEFDLVSE